MSLFSMSVPQVLDLWSELEQAYHGTNRYRQNAAEIWAHNLMPNSPTYHERFASVAQSDAFKSEIETVESSAMSALYELLTRFARNRNADILINGRPLGKWLKKQRRMVRWEVQVVPREADLREALQSRAWWPVADQQAA